MLIPRVHISYKFSNIKIKKVGVFKSKYFWEQIDLPVAVGGRFLINLANFAPIFKKNQICVIHDTLAFCFPKSYSWKFGLITRYFHKKIVSRTNMIGTVSKFSAKEIQKNIGIPKNDIIVFENSAEHLINFKAEQVFCSELLPRKYILAVFSQKNSFYKNIQNYLIAIKDIDYKFVCIGNVSLEGFTVPKNILQPGFVSDEHLKWLLMNAYALVSPSFYEGFGIPVLEGMVCGCPVLASDIEVFHEVCDGASIYFDPYNPNDIKQKITSLLENPEMRSELVKNGYKVSSKYKWEHNATKLISEIINTMEIN